MIFLTATFVHSDTAYIGLLNVPAYEFRCYGLCVLTIFVFVYVETQSIVMEEDMTRVMVGTTVVPAKAVVMHLILATTSDTTSAPRPLSPPPRPVTESPLIRPQFL